MKITLKEEELLNHFSQDQINRLNQEAGKIVSGTDVERIEE